MRIQSIRLIRLLQFILLPLISNAQEVVFPLDEWKAKLSVKQDLGAIQRQEVYKDLIALDSAQYCKALTLLHEQARNGNTRFQIRLDLLQVYLSYISRRCPESLPNRDVLETALRKCYEIGDNVLAVDVHQALSNACLVDGEVGLAVMHSLLAKELMEKEGLHLFRNYAMSLYTLADILYRWRDYRMAASINEQALRYRGDREFNKMDSLDNYWRMNAWNTLGLSYERLGVYDSAFYAFNQAYKFANDPFWKGLIMGNRGDVFFLQGQYDSAEVLLKYDYEQSLAAYEYHNAAITLLRLARITNARGDRSKALTMIKEADTLEQRSPNADYRVAILYGYALVYKDLGIADSAFAYMERYKALNDSIEKRAADNRAEIIRLRLNNEENVHEILALKKDKNRIRLIRNFSIALILVLSVLGYLYINRIRLKATLKHQEALEEKRKAEAEAENAREQLHLFTENLREKTKMIEDLQSQMLKKELDQEQLEHIQELTSHTILTDTDWDRFKTLFTRVYPGFFVQLKQQVPDMTLAEQRMAALIKLQTSNKDAASMLGVSLNSIHKTRQRLRQRLNIEQDAELDVYFRGIDLHT